MQLGVRDIDVEDVALSYPFCATFFDDIEFTEAGVYNYIIKEVVPSTAKNAAGDAYVRNDAQDAFAAKAGSCELVKLPGLRHELYMNEGEGLRQYWEKIFAFYEA